MKFKNAIKLTLLLLPLFLIVFHRGRQVRVQPYFRDSLRERHPCSRPEAVPETGETAHAANSSMARGVFSCLSCHDGTIAPVDSSYSGNSGYPDPAYDGGSASHPVGMDYMEVMRRRPGDYNDPRTNPGIRLSDNKVTCLSCHDKEVSRGFGVPGSQTSLCLACHKL